VIGPSRFAEKVFLSLALSARSPYLHRPDTTHKRDRDRDRDRDRNRDRDRERERERERPRSQTEAHSTPDWKPRHSNRSDPNVFKSRPITLAESERAEIGFFEQEQRLDGRKER
jgi:ATP-dependent RNA helicase DDX23/PRP28